MSIDILLKFNKHDPVADFILVEALSDKAKEEAMVLGKIDMYVAGMKI